LWLEWRPSVGSSLWAAGLKVFGVNNYGCQYFFSHRHRHRYSAPEPNSISIRCAHPRQSHHPSYPVFPEIAPAAPVISALFGVTETMDVLGVAALHDGTIIG
jgi:hypothetical protein